MLISDWSSDVCSSDLVDGIAARTAHADHGDPRRQVRCRRRYVQVESHVCLQSPWILDSRAGCAGPRCSDTAGTSVNCLLKSTLAASAPGGRRGRPPPAVPPPARWPRSEEHTSELQSLMRISYAVFCLKKK